MSTMPSVKPRKLVVILKRDGFEELRQVGSHLHLYHRVKRLRVTVPMHTKDLKRKTLVSILRQALLTTDEFIKLLH